MQFLSIVIAMSDEMERARLADGLGRRSGFTVLRETTDLMQTYTIVEEKSPQVVLIDQDMASRPEFEVMHALFQALDIRWLVLAAPGRHRSADRVHSQRSDLFPVDAGTPIDQIAETILTVTRSRLRPLPPQLAQTQSLALKRDEKLVLIGASTGGVDALLSVLSGYPADGPATLIVQHTGRGFGASLANLLDRQCACKVKVAEDGEELRRGQILVAGGCSKHLQLDCGSTLRARLVDGQPRGGHMPSVDMLFESALPVARRCSAALLTGMGRDGAEGLLALRAAGATTLAQDAATSTVYGMPRAAAELGAAMSVLPLSSICQAILKSCDAPTSVETRERPRCS
ncbi:chemotaxis protein CheB [Puniceibacterium sediminis]|uniref:protein-glutamate methylesterase n=1 Tax=Puniceibacterium sediminis TaxID=1608407 RepID=A0A238Y0E7_9RHOB|nr:chemotaxis protein CheB [Puniceibacterium sediminis]SNR64113.1 two-component system, chemotaxis family, response regulator CheB [Puniceibacterium sediminis]